jgi:predicted anti-sigma-YlaC factor YlaD
MKIDKNIIMDLLPTYLANEASPETRAMVEEYLAENPDMARLVQMQKDSLRVPGIPVPLTRNHQISAYKRSRMQLALFILIAVLLLLGFVGALVMMFMRPI